MFFILLLALQKDILTAYFYALGFSLFFVLLYIVKILNRNLYQWIPFVIGLVLIPYAIRQFNITPKAMIEPMIGGILMYQTCSQYGWTQKRYALTESMYGAMLMSCLLYTSRFENAGNGWHRTHNKNKKRKPKYTSHRIKQLFRL